MVPGILDPEMIEDTARIVNEAMKGKVQVRNRAGVDRISGARWHD
jgi:hypothetical protein